MKTGSVLERYRVVERKEIITVASVFGMNMFRGFFAGIRYIFGGCSSVSQQVLRDSSWVCLAELRRESLLSKASDVIAVDLHYSEISDDDKSMRFLVASGTAVVVEKT